METSQKEKLVDFSLSKFMKMPDLIKKGFQRKEIIALFETLEAEGMGIYTRGSIGKGKCSSFDFMVDPPEKRRMTFYVDRLHTEYAGKPGEDTRKPIPFSEEEKEERRVSFNAHSYQVSIENGKLVVVLIEGGSKSIQHALDKIWDKVSDKVKEPHYNHMSTKDVVVSKLMGLGYYNLEQ